MFTVAFSYFLIDNMVKIPYYTHIDITSEEIYE